MISELIYNCVVMLGPMILAVTVHEYAHVQMATFLGDDTGRRLGRLTLDPLQHIDLTWTVMLPLMLVVAATLSGAGTFPLIGAGRPSPYDPRYLKRKFFGKVIPTRYAELLVALAGPFSNLLLAFITVSLLWALSYKGIDQMNGKPLLELGVHFVSMNLSLFVFNLIPIPPLDGSKMILAFLSPKAAMAYEGMMPTLSLGLLAVLLLGGGAILVFLVQFLTHLIFGFFLF